MLPNQYQSVITLNMGQHAESEQNEKNSIGDGNEKPGTILTMGKNV